MFTFFFSFLVFPLDSLYRLVPPDLYVVFSSDLEVTFHLPGNVSLPNAFVKLEGLVAKNNHWIEITTMGLPLGRKTGSLIAACGIVEFAGRYGWGVLWFDIFCLHFH